MLDHARVEVGRTVAALAARARAGAWIVGLEPSCLYTLRDEAAALIPGDDARVVSERAFLLEEFLDREWDAGRRLTLREPPSLEGSSAHPTTAADRPVLLHGHCHQKAFGGTDATLRMLRRVPGHEVKLIESSCCGMAGAFGYHAEHYDTSMAMGELSLLPTVRGAPPGAVIVADGTSCRAQISDGTGREALHAVVLIERALG